MFFLKIKFSLAAIRFLSDLLEFLLFMVCGVEVGLLRASF